MVAPPVASARVSRCSSVCAHGNACRFSFERVAGGAAEADVGRVALHRRADEVAGQERRDNRGTRPAGSGRSRCPAAAAARRGSACSSSPGPANQRLRRADQVAVILGAERGARVAGHGAVVEQPLERRGGAAGPIAGRQVRDPVISPKTRRDACHRRVYSPSSAYGSSSRYMSRWRRTTRCDQVRAQPGRREEPPGPHRPRRVLLVERDPKCSRDTR